MTGVRLTRRAAVGLIAAAACGGATGFAEGPEAGDTVEGAMWRMRMTSRARKGLVRGTAFRVSNGQIYQRIEPKPDAEEEVVGRDEAKGKFRETTVLNFENLRVFELGAGRKPPERISGTARINKDEFGKYHGRLIDGEGRHWDVSLTRFKE